MPHFLWKYIYFFIQLCIPDPAAFTILIWVCVIRKLCYCSCRSPTVFIADPADSLLHSLTWYCLLQKLAQVTWGRVSTEASSAATSSVCTVGVVSHFPVQWAWLEHGLGREECAEITPWHQEDGFWHLSPFCALIFGLRVFVCRVEFLSLTRSETETTLYIKGALVEGGAGLVSDERMDSSSLHKSSLSV